MNASSWKKAADIVTKMTPASPQASATSTAKSQNLQNLPLSALSIDDSGPPQVTYEPQQPIATSTPWATDNSEIPTEAYRQILPGMSSRLYPTLITDSSLDAHVSDQQDTLQTQLSTEVDKYHQEVAAKREMDVNYFDAQHLATNLINHHQTVESANLENDDIPELLDNDTGKKTEKVGCLQVTNQLREFLIHFPPDSKEKAFEQIYEILQVLNTYLIDNPQQHIHCMSPENEYVLLIMYAVTIEIDLCNFLAIWAVLSILLDTQSNTLQHAKSFQQVVNNYYDKRPTDVMSKLEQQASIIMKAMYDSVNNEHSDSVSGDIDRVSGAVDSDYDVNDSAKDESVMPYDKDESVMPYDKDESVMPYDKEENVMPYDKEKHEMPYDSDNQYMSDDNDDDQMPTKYDNGYETVIDEMKCDENMKSYEQIDVGKKDVVTHNRAYRIPTKEKRPIETKDVDDDFMREYYEMYKSMEHKQIRDYYEARRHIQSTMEGDTPTKTGQNTQCIDNIRDYNREYDRILNSVCHTLDLGPNMLLGAQQHTTVESAAALSIQEKFKGKYEDKSCNANGQYRNEWYKRAENMVPQLDGTYNVSDDSDIDSHSYLDLASSNIIAYRMLGSKREHKA